MTCNSLENVQVYVTNTKILKSPTHALLRQSYFEDSFDIRTHAYEWTFFYICLAHEVLEAKLLE
jgi:hypothetical protein